MTKKKWIVSVLIAIIVLAVLAGAGYAVYRYGYIRGVAAAEDGTVVFGRFPGHLLIPDADEDSGDQYFFQQQNPRNFNFREQNEVAPNPFMRSQNLIQPFSRSTFVSPFSAFFRLVICVIILWVAYKVLMAIFGGAGWHLSFQKLPKEDEAPEGKASPKKKA